MSATDKNDRYILMFMVSFRCGVIPVRFQAALARAEVVDG